ncbi:alpha/beta fold hydrolase [Gandjariella thermophila]|uniref:Hydrolase n=1 Tax=Gandjariella thermophila TaxID=1931992 RepID=A0A4D4J630_9PSEU|nr:alpha/beta fold hydrolase [Gandjariella thermophila]GDY30039.1 hydrolase [Gandjariella thermophila]
MTETRSQPQAEPIVPARPSLTRVPLSDGPLPPLDNTIPPWPGRQVDVAGTRLHVRETPNTASDGSTAVYVHGLGGSSTNWTDLAGLLSGHARGLAPDLPGFGRSEPPDGYDYSLPSHAGTLARFIEGLHRGPVHLFGNSFGGAIALVLAAHRPELVRSLTLISPAVPDLRPDVRRLSDPRLPLALLPVVGRRVRRALAALTPRERIEQMLRLCFADPSVVPEHRIEEAAREAAERATQPWTGLALGRTTVGLVRTWFAPRAQSLWTLAPRVTVPALVVWGADDRVVSVRKAPRTAELLPRGRLLVLPRTGHCAQMERPLSVARAVLGMWQAADQGTW